MNKKILSATFILAIIMTISFIYQPHLAKVSAQEDKLLIFDRISPTGEVYKGDVVKFGGTIYNNLSLTQELIRLEVRFFNETERTIALKDYIYQYSFSEQTFRNIIEPGEVKTTYFEREIDLPIGDNYTAQLFVLHKNKDESIGDQAPPETQIGKNVTLNVLIRRDEAPVYIYIVLILLLLAILAFVVAGVVSWAREKRGK
ncbi:MAG: hypothetical protein GF308_13920 [Candidatus Heimdallarchaeota archaeon]|nr:hypothetical protein [Candidatus Heimdallarchaeota archaeon]